MDEFCSSVPQRTGAGQYHVTYGLNWTMAFQPIVDVDAKTIFGYEALLRGCNNEAAPEVLALVPPGDGMSFDIACTEAAIDLALKLNVPAMLTINVGAETLASPQLAVEIAAAAAASKGFPAGRILLEVTPGVTALDRANLPKLLAGYERHGFATAIDRFGLSHSGLDLLADIRPKAVKLSVALVRNVDADPVQRSVVAGIAQLCKEMGIRVIAVGVERAEECRALRDAGLHLFQGHCFAAPRFEALPGVPVTVWGRIERRALSNRGAINPSGPDRRSR